MLLRWVVVMVAMLAGFTQAQELSIMPILPVVPLPAAGGSRVLPS